MKKIIFLGVVILIIIALIFYGVKNFSNAQQTEIVRPQPTTTIENVSIGKVEDTIKNLKCLFMIFLLILNTKN